MRIAQLKHAQGAYNSVAAYCQKGGIFGVAAAGIGQFVRANLEGPSAHGDPKRFAFQAQHVCCCLICALFAPDLLPYFCKQSLSISETMLNFKNYQSKSIIYGISLLRPGRIALVQKCRNSFFGVPVQHIFDHDMTCVGVGFGNGHLQLFVKRLLSDFNGHSQF